MNELNVRNCRLIELPKIGDEKRGYLSFMESLRSIPFEIKRVYYIYGVGDSSAMRGEHAHKENLEQIFFCINGSVTFLLDDGERKDEYELKDPNIGIYIGPKLWHTLVNFSKDAIVLVVASDYYTEELYIRDYDKFIEYVHRGE